MSETAVGFMYFGYIMGLLVTLFNKKIRNFFIHESTAVITGIVIFILGTAGFFAENIYIMFVFMFTFLFTLINILLSYLTCKNQLRS